MISREGHGFRIADKSNFSPFAWASAFHDLPGMYGMLQVMRPEAVPGFEPCFWDACHFPAIFS